MGFIGNTLNIDTAPGDFNQENLTASDLLEALVEIDIVLRAGNCILNKNAHTCLAPQSKYTYIIHAAFFFAAMPPTASSTLLATPSAASMSLSKPISMQGTDLD